MNSHLRTFPVAIPTPRKVPRQARARATVDAILDAAARLLVEQGYADTTTNSVAEIAGVSIGSLYQYFPNKDALIVALHRRHAQQMHAVMTAALEGSRQGSLRASLARLPTSSSPALHRPGAPVLVLRDEDLAGPWS